MIKFYKMHGLGNDFVIVSYDSVSNLNIPEIASNISDRYLGIGCDQFIVYKETTNKKEFQIWIYNNDGTLAGACGNAMRCLMKLFHIQYGYKNLIFDVMGRKIQANVTENNEYKINMGKASFNENWMPSIEKLWHEIGMDKIFVQNAMIADIGNRHFILFLEPKITEEQKYKLASRLEKSIVPNGVNINCAILQNNKISLKVWERDTGFTLACGSGACVTAAAAYKLGMITNNIQVSFEKGDLGIFIDENNNIFMSGPADLVAEGNIFV